MNWNFSSRFFERISSWLVASKELVATNHGQLCHVPFFPSSEQSPNNQTSLALWTLQQNSHVMDGDFDGWIKTKSLHSTSVTRICGGHCLYCRCLSLPSYTQAAAPGQGRWEYALISWMLPRGQGMWLLPILNHNVWCNQHGWHLTYFQEWFKYTLLSTLFNPWLNDNHACLGLKLL